MWSVMLRTTMSTIGSGHRLSTVDQPIDFTLKSNLQFEIARCFQVCTYMR